MNYMYVCIYIYIYIYIGIYSLKKIKKWKIDISFFFEGLKIFMFDGRAINQESKYLYVNNVYMCGCLCVWMERDNLRNIIWK